jgi:putative ABC transport system substrate-binding protein
MRRRSFLWTVTGAAALPGAALAQLAPKMLRVGTANTQPRSAPQWVAFERRMAEIGYVTGKNLTFDHVQIPSTEAWEASYRGVVERKADIIVAAGPALSLKSAMAATATLPIVMIAVDYDPIDLGFVTSLARPTGNITGVHIQQIELAPKRLQLLKDAFPEMTAAIVFWDGLSADQWAAAQAAAPKLGVQLTGVGFRDHPYNYDKALAETTPEHRKFLFLLASPYFFLDRVRLAEFSLRHRMISSFTVQEQVAAGGLMSYGVSLTEMWELAASYVDRIAKGAKPADLPIQQPTKFELVINLKSAKSLGITLPPDFVLRADVVIE